MMRRGVASSRDFIARAWQRGGGLLRLPLSCRWPIWLTPIATIEDLKAARPFASNAAKDVLTDRSLPLLDACTDSISANSTEYAPNRRLEVWLVRGRGFLQRGDE